MRKPLAQLIITDYDDLGDIDIEYKNFTSVSHIFKTHMIGGYLIFKNVLLDEVKQLVDEAIQSGDINTISTRIDKLSVDMTNVIKQLLDLSKGGKNND